MTFAVRVADEQGAHALEAETAGDLDPLFDQEGLGILEGLDAQCHVGIAGIFAVDIHQDVLVGRLGAGAQKVEPRCPTGGAS